VSKKQPAVSEGFTGTAITARHTPGGNLFELVELKIKNNAVVETKNLTPPDAAFIVAKKAEQSIWDIIKEEAK
jgi:hypothetical protein